MNTTTKKNSMNKINPHSFMAMLCSGALLYTVKNWDAFKREVAEGNGKAPDYYDSDPELAKVWAEGRENIAELGSLLTTFSLISSDPEHGDEMAAMFMRVLAGAAHA